MNILTYTILAIVITMAGLLVAIILLIIMCVRRHRKNNFKAKPVPRSNEPEAPPIVQAGGEVVVLPPDGNKTDHAFV